MKRVDVGVCLSACALTGQQLDDGSEDESLPLLELEQLKDEDKEADAAQDGGQDHGGLDGLQVHWKSGRGQGGVVGIVTQ